MSLQRLDAPIDHFSKRLYLVLFVCGFGLYETQQVLGARWPSQTQHAQSRLRRVLAGAGLRVFGPIAFRTEPSSLLGAEMQQCQAGKIGADIRSFG